MRNIISRLLKLAMILCVNCQQCRAVKVYHLEALYDVKPDCWSVGLRLFLCWWQPWSWRNKCKYWAEISEGRCRHSQETSEQDLNTNCRSAARSEGNGRDPKWTGRWEFWSGNGVHSLCLWILLFDDWMLQCFHILQDPGQGAVWSFFLCFLIIPWHCVLASQRNEEEMSTNEYEMTYNRCE